MASKHDGQKNIEFEQLMGREDVQVSKVLSTPNGTKVRAIVTTGESLILTRIGQRGGSTIVVTGGYDSEDVGVSVALSWVDVLGPLIDAVLDKIKGDKSGGGGQKCESVTTITSDAKSGTTTITITQKCGPA